MSDNVDYEAMDYEAIAEREAGYRHDAWPMPRQMICADCGLDVEGDAAARRGFRHTHRTRPNDRPVEA